MLMKGRMIGWICALTPHTYVTVVKSKHRTYEYMFQNQHIWKKNNSLQLTIIKLKSGSALVNNLICVHLCSWCSTINKKLQNFQHSVGQIFSCCQLKSRFCVVNHSSKQQWRQVKVSFTLICYTSFELSANEFLFGLFFDLQTRLINKIIFVASKQSY